MHRLPVNVPQRLPALPSVPLPGSLLILDEAHHAAPASGGRYGIETKFTRAVRDLAGRFEHRLFLSATPHNGHSNSFSTLLERLDPYRFTRGVKVRGRGALEAVMVRRLKEDIRAVQGGFPRRDVVRLDLDADERARIEAVTTTAEAGLRKDAAMEAAWRREQVLLERMEVSAGEARHRPDAKARRLLDWLATEPGCIGEFYAVRAWRIEPVGLVYLWPETN